MSTSDLQLLYEREKQELENLKERLNAALSKKQTAESFFKEIKEKKANLKSNIEKLESDFDVLFEKIYRILSFTAILGLFVAMLAAVLGIFFIMMGSPLLIVNVLKIPIYNNIKGTLLLFGSWLGGFLVLNQLWNKGMPVACVYLQEKLFNYLTNKVENSNEYKKMAFLHEISLELYEREEIDFIEKEDVKNDAVQNYITIKKEYDAKKRIVEYLGRQINPIETSLNLKRVLKSNHNIDNNICD